MDFTHVRNSGAAFGILNDAEFPFKTVVIAVIATAALVGVGLYAASLAHHQLVARIGLALIIGGAAGNLIDRIIAGSVVDFVDVYWQNHHFWAFNVADSAISVGVAIMILDMLGIGTACIQDCLNSDRSRSTPTACCWRRPTCSACSWRWFGPRSAASTRIACSTSASTSSSARWSAPSCCC